MAFGAACFYEACVRFCGVLLHPTTSSALVWPSQAWRCGRPPGGPKAGRGSAPAAGARFRTPLFRHSVWGLLRSFELPGLARPRLWCGGWPRSVAVPCAWARPFKLSVFSNFGGVVAAPPLSRAGCSLATRSFPPPRLPDALES